LSLSTVIENGIPISSDLAYFLPKVTPVLSVLHEIPNFLSDLVISSVNYVNYSLFIIGNIEHLHGAILGGNLKYYFWGSSLYRNECSTSDYNILPIPNDGSITFGVNFSSITLIIFFSNFIKFFVNFSYFESYIKIFSSLFS